MIITIVISKHSALFSTNNIRLPILKLMSRTTSSHKAITLQYNAWDGWYGGINSLVHMALPAQINKGSQVSICILTARSFLNSAHSMEGAYRHRQNTTVCPTSHSKTQVYSFMYAILENKPNSINIYQRLISCVSKFYQHKYKLGWAPMHETLDS